MINILIYIIVIIMLVGFAMWLIDYMPLQQPLNKWAKIIVIFVGAIALILVLLRVAGVETGPLPR